MAGEFVVWLQEVDKLSERFVVKERQRQHVGHNELSQQNVCLLRMRLTELSRAETSVG